MTNPIGSKSISVGHVIAEDGDARVTLNFDPDAYFAALSPKGARLVAKQLLDWADHAEEWTKKSSDDQARDWIQLKNRIALDTSYARPPEG